MGSSSVSQAGVHVTTIRADHLPHAAIGDLIEGLRRHEVWTTLAMHEVRQRFRRSVLGPLWITLSMGIVVGAMGLVFSELFGQDASQTLPYISVGLIFWGLLTGTITDGTTAFIGNEAYIRNVPLPISVHFYRMLTRNLIVWGFNMAIYVVVLLWFRIFPGWQALLFVPGFLLFIINAAWMGLAAGILSARYRDIPQVITNAIQVVFFLTPIFWSPETLPRRPAFVDWNPLYHLIELVRNPLLGRETPAQGWLFAVGLAAVGVFSTIALYRRAYARIAYWV